MKWLNVCSFCGNLIIRTSLTCFLCILQAFLMPLNRVVFVFLRMFHFVLAIALHPLSYYYYFQPGILIQLEKMVGGELVFVAPQCSNWLIKVIDWFGRPCNWLKCFQTWADWKAACSSTLSGPQGPMSGSPWRAETVDVRWYLCVRSIWSVELKSLVSWLTCVLFLSKSSRHLLF